MLSTSPKGSLAIMSSILFSKNTVQAATNPSYVAINDRNDTVNGQAEYLYAKLTCFHLKYSNMFDLPVDEPINLTTP